jgi:uracil-DNA glycosylase family 4
MTSMTDEPRALERLDLIAVPAPLPPHERAEERTRHLAALHEEMAACRNCQITGYLAQANPVAGFRGRIGNRMLLIGQAPGRLSTLKNEPFSGPGGRMLETWLQRAGFAPGALRREVYLSALTRCDPGRNPRGSGDRKPSPPELALCRPYLLRELELVRPHAILLVGGMAIAAFLGAARLEEVVGEAFERNGAHLLPLPHPSGVSRWLNDTEHQALLARGLDWLSTWRQEWLAEDAAMASATTASNGGTDGGD